MTLTIGLWYILSFPAPPLTDLAMFNVTSAEVIERLRQNKEARDSVQQQFVRGANGIPADEAALKELTVICNQLDYLDWALRDRPILDRRRNLAHYRKLIGQRRYYQGYVPQPIPLTNYFRLRKVR